MTFPFKFSLNYDYEYDEKIKWMIQQGIASLLLWLVFDMYFWAMTKFLKFLKQRRVCCF